MTPDRPPRGAAGEDSDVHQTPLEERELLALFFRTPDPSGGPPTTKRLPVRDRHGGERHDLLRNVPRALGTTDFRIVGMSVDQRIVSLPNTFEAYSCKLLPGQLRPLAPTQVVLQLRLANDDSRHRLLGLDADGEVTFDYAVASNWSRFQLSPGGRYLVGRSDTAAVLLDTKDGQHTELAPLQSFHGVGFTTNDGHLAQVVDREGEHRLLLRDLTNAQSRTVSLPAEHASKPVRIEGSVPDGFLLSLDGGMVTTRLYFLHRDGRLIPFHTGPLPVYERALGLSRAGRVIFMRSPELPR